MNAVNKIDLVTGREIERTGVATAAMAASLALDLLAKLHGGTKAAALRESEILRRVAEEDVAAYNRYLRCTPAERGLALREAIEVPMKAARSVVAGIELCAAAVESVRAPMTADLGAAAALLHGALRGILLCVDANLHGAPAGDPNYATLRAERRELQERAQVGEQAMMRNVSA